MTLYDGLLQCAAIGLVAFVISHVAKRAFSGRSTLKNIPGPPPMSWITGNMRQLYDRHQGWDLEMDITENYGPVAKFHGLFGEEMLFVSDPVALQTIILKQQPIFEESPAFLLFAKMFFGEGLLSSLGEHHKSQRKILNPVFSTNHIRLLSPTFFRIVNKVRETLTKEVSQGPKEVDMLDWMTRTALELVGQGGFGYSFDSLEDDTPNQFAETLKDTVPAVGPIYVILVFFPWITKIGSAKFRRRILELLPWKRMQKILEISDMLERTGRDILTHSRETMSNGDVPEDGRDILKVLLEANQTTGESERLSEEELLGQISTLLFAAMDTTSGALAHALHMLAERPDVQDKLRQEILQAQEQGEDIPFDTLMNLPYLEAVCRETLRVHSPVTTLLRRTTQETVIPLSNPIRGEDGSLVKDIPVSMNTDIHIGILACNRSKAIWGEDSFEWKPERFLSPLPQTVTEARVPGVYSNLMSFLGGGRACIGFKFSQLEMKVVLSVLISAFQFEMPEQEICWNHGGIQYPTVGRESDTPKLPLRLSLYKQVS
ncbi:cytochrome P450 [Abortiporus biennis]|nr:cytochrome P450 [Abortiporus biennis]